MKFNYDLNSPDRDLGFSIPENDIIDADKANAVLGKISHAAVIIKALPLIVFGILILLFTFFINGLSNRYTKNCTVEADGYVVSFDEWVTKDDNNKETLIGYAPVVRFTAEDGKQYESIYSTYSSDKICEENTAIRILYDPEDPSKIDLPDFKKNDLLSDILCILPIIILPIAGICIFKKGKRRTDRKIEPEL